MTADPEGAGELQIPVPGWVIHGNGSVSQAGSPSGRGEPTSCGRPEMDADHSSSLGHVLVLAPLPTFLLTRWPALTEATKKVPSQIPRSQAVADAAAISLPRLQKSTQH